LGFGRGNTEIWGVQGRNAAVGRIEYPDNIKIKELTSQKNRKKKGEKGRRAGKPKRGCSHVISVSYKRRRPLSVHLGGRLCERRKGIFWTRGLKGQGGGKRTRRVDIKTFLRANDLDSNGKVRWEASNPNRRGEGPFPSSRVTPRKSPSTP